MKNYTKHFLIITVVTALVGFTGLTFPGDTAVRFICLLSGIGLMISCLDAVLVSQKRKQLKKQTEKAKGENQV